MNEIPTFHVYYIGVPFGVPFHRWVDPSEEGEGLMLEKLYRKKWKSLELVPLRLRPVGEPPFPTF